MIENLLIFAFSLFLVIKGGTLATRYSVKLAKHFHFSKYVVGFIIVAMISILPEMLIAISSAMNGIPAFGLGTLFGSNIADLTLIFAILIIFAGRGIKIESKILKDVHLYPFFLLIPLVLGLNGHYSRLEGAALMITGALFYYLVFKNGVQKSTTARNGNGKYKSVLCLLGAVALLLVGSHFVVTSATALAHAFNVTPILIGLLIVSLGTTIPELFYSLESVYEKNDGLAIGDILGTVLADATVVVGVLAFISPFSFPVKIIYITGAFMMVAALVLLHFMRSGRVISKKEGVLLLVFWVAYVLVEFFANK